MLIFTHDFINKTMIILSEFESKIYTKQKTRINEEQFSGDYFAFKRLSEAKLIEIISYLILNFGCSVKCRTAKPVKSIRK